MRIKVLASVAMSLVLLLLVGGRAQAALIGATGTGGGTGTLVSIDPLTGTATVIGLTNDGIGNNYRLTGLAFDPFSGVLYGSSGNSSPTNPGTLVTVDPMTGLVTLIGSYGTGGTMADLTFTPDGTLYGWLEPSADDMYSINRSTGAATLIGDSGLGTFGSGIASNGSGVIYFAGSSDNGPLRTINRVTGVPTDVVTLGGGPVGGGPINALAFSPSGVLYGINGSFGTTTYLITVNTTTGSITSIGQSFDRLDAIAFGSDAVPEPTTMSLLAAGCLAGWVLRRRRVA